MKRIELGNKISSRRRELKLSQEAAAEKADIGLATYKRIEQGKNSCKLETLENISAALDIKMSNLLPSKLRTILNRLFDDDDSNETEWLLNRQNVFYPEKNEGFDYPITTLLEFIMYLPLVNIAVLFDSLNRFAGELFQYESYVCDQLSYVYKNIEDDEMKKFADYQCGKLNYDYFRNYYDENTESYDEYEESTDYIIGKDKYISRLKILCNFALEIERIRILFTDI